ncbi:MAG: DUF6268 family outer membrane beta-barrel protein [Verrucomicrobiota bacterium]|nr:DUF6268 family outer membrane beta-barrel protein [Verrucomicrobiota bacterium]
MRKLSALAFLAAVTSLTAVRAGETQSYSDTTSVASSHGETALDLFRLDTSYVFESRLDNRFGLASDQGAFHSSIEYSHRFLLTGRFYFRAGIGYDRFDFGGTQAPVPVHLQAMSALLGLEYMVGNDVGAFLYLRPGYYTEDHIGSSSFDVPVTAGRVFVLQPDKLYFVLGATGAGLRGEFPILPFAGLIWKPSEQWNFQLVPPEPRVTYSPNKKLDLYAAAELVGASFRTDRDANILPRKLSNAQVDYTEYRAGVGLQYHCGPRTSFSVSGGYAFQRRFNFDRANVDFTADPAPYVRAAFRAEF